MGIAIADLEHFLLLKKRFPGVLTGRVLQLGRQDIYFSDIVFQAMAAALEVELAVKKDVACRKHQWAEGIQTISDEHFFSSLGFEVVDSLDFVADEGPTIVHDLNMNVHYGLYEKFDVVFDGGTLEHVFNIASGFRNIHSVLKPGGVVIHSVPTNNFVDHGFYAISPTLLVDASCANGYEILETIVVKVKRENLHNGPYGRVAYDPGVFGNYTIGGHDADMLLTWHVARKPLVHRPWVNPVQGFYQRHWKR